MPYDVLRETWLSLGGLTLAFLYSSIVDIGNGNFPIQDLNPSIRAIISDPAGSEMTQDDIGNETFTAPSVLIGTGECILYLYCSYG